MKYRLIQSVTIAVMTMFPVYVHADDQEHVRERIQEQKQDRIYGSQLMTRHERAEYRARIRSAKTTDERDQIRKEHHEHMKERAKAKGLSLPDDPPVRGGGMGPGRGLGPDGGRGR